MRFSFARPVALLAKTLPAILLLMCWLLAFRPLNADGDFWAHAAVGRWIWQHHAIPSHGLFLWSSEPTPWVAHSWGTQLLFYALLQLGGGWNARGMASDGAASVGFGPHVVVIFTSCVIALVFALLWRLWNRRARPANFAVLMFSMAFFMGALRFYPRPEIFTALFWTLLLLFLIENRNDEYLQRQNVDEKLHDEKPRDEHRRAEHRRAERRESETSSTRSSLRDGLRLSAREIGLVALFVVWTNLHGAVILGVALLVSTALCDTIQFRADRKSRRLLLLSALCVAATALNPYGFFAYWNAVTSSSQSATFSFIYEWRAPLPVSEWRAFRESGVLPPLLLHAVVMIVLAITSLVLWRARLDKRWAQMLWVLVMTFLFFQQRRHMWLASLTCLAVLADNAAAFGNLKPAQMWKDKLRAAPLTPLQNLLRIGFVASVWLFAFALSTKWVNKDAWNIVSRQLPDGACAALQTHFTIAKNTSQRALQTVRIFNEYENSSYLQWRLNADADANGAHRVLDVRNSAAKSAGKSASRFPLFIDLLNAYPDRVTNEYLRLLNSDGDQLRKRGAQAVVFSGAQRDGALAKKLDADRKWRHLYRGDDGDVWVLNEIRRTIER